MESIIRVVVVLFFILQVTLFVESRSPITDTLDYMKTIHVPENEIPKFKEIFDKLREKYCLPKIMDGWKIDKVQNCHPILANNPLAMMCKNQAIKGKNLNEQRIMACSGENTSQEMRQIYRDCLQKNGYSKEDRPDPAFLPPSPSEHMDLLRDCYERALA